MEIQLGVFPDVNQSDIVRSTTSGSSKNPDIYVNALDESSTSGIGQ